MLVKKSRFHSFVKWLFALPARAIVLSFLFVDLIGTILLMLPIASQDGRSIGFLKAFFTCISATCVTGLVVVDTATHFTTFGKVIIIALIQIGGLGLVTITTFIISLARRRVGLKAKVLAQESSGSFSMIELPKVLKSIVLTTLAFEFVGFIFFATQYVPMFGWADGLGKAGFQAISAFCNAGFDLLGDTSGGKYVSLVGMNNYPVVILTTAFLIIAGGLGFNVWKDIFTHKKGTKLMLNSKVSIIMTISLLLAGTIFFLLSEWSNTGVQAMGTLPEWQRPIAAFFQSVTLRTAGFNTINQVTLHDESKLVSVVMMFIGAGSGSTGGGIKTSTLAVLIYSVIADVRRSDGVLISKQRIPIQLVQRAVTILFLGMGIMMTLSILLCISESAALASGRIEYLDLLFESASAFGTVGVTSALTPELSTLSHIFIIPAMFLGRVGPATFALSLALREVKLQTNIYPEAKLQVG